MATSMEKPSTAKKTTTRKKATTPKAEKPVVEQNVVEVKEEAPVKTEAKVMAEKPVKNVAKIYDKDDLITCRSVTAGYLGIVGPRTGQLYPFENMGDIGYVEFQDLNSWLASRNRVLFDPCIVIEDDTLLEDVRWQEIVDIYKDMYDTTDINDILNLPPREFSKRFPKLPNGLKNAIKSEMTRQIQDGTFDSIQKIKVVDDVCGTSIGAIIANS